MKLFCYVKIKISLFRYKYSKNGVLKFVLSAYSELYICLMCCWLLLKANCLYAKKNCEICFLCAWSDPNKFIAHKNCLFFKLNEVFDFQFCKLMQNTIRRFVVDHNFFTPVSLVHSHYTWCSKKSNFVLERPRTLLGLNFFNFLGSKLWSSVP